MNAYLKEIADLCGVNKELTYHIARHTFATTITLSNGVSIESVSKMLGHKNMRTTQHYAKILDSKVSEDMILLKQKFIHIKIRKCVTIIFFNAYKNSPEIIRAAIHIHIQISHYFHLKSQKLMTLIFLLL